MAKVLGKAGRYVSEQSVKKSRRIILLLFLFVIGLGFVEGYLIGVKHNYIITLAVLLVLSLAWIYLSKKITALENDRLNFRKGAAGEAIVAFTLDNFPDDFRVIHDLTTPYGNIDHVVIGPTGAYIIDTKNWKGTVSADGSGELLLNRRPTQKTEVKNLSRRIMSIKEKINILSSLDPFLQGVFAFPSAYIEAKWGTTGYVNCVSDERLYDYIVENKRGKKMSQKEIDSISQAFLSLAIMDKDFGQNGSR